MDLHVTNICYFDTRASKRVFSRQVRATEAIQKVRSVLQ